MTCKRCSSLHSRPICGGVWRAIIGSAPANSECGMRPPAPRSWGRAGNAECEEELQLGGPREESSGRDGRSVTGDEGGYAQQPARGSAHPNTISSGGTDRAAQETPYCTTRPAGCQKRRGGCCLKTWSSERPQ